MNLAFVTQCVSPLGGGTGIYYETITRHLAALGHRVWLITSTKKEAEPYQRDGVRYTYVAAPRSPVPGTTLLLWEWRVCRVLRDIDAQYGLDTVEFPSYYPEGLLYALMPRRAPVCVRLHEWKNPLRLARLRYDRWNLFRELLCWVGMARAEGLLPVSGALERNYVEFMGDRRVRGKMFRHYGAIDVCRFQPTSDLPAAYRPLAGKRIILFVGRITRAKGVYSLLEAYATRIAQRFKDTALVLAGRPEDEEDFKRSMAGASASRVVHLAHVDHDSLPAFYSHAYVFVGPSRREPFGLVFAEALACGLPVISVNDGGPSEIVENGRTGILCPDNAADSIAKALERVLADPILRDRMAQEARASVVDRFSMERVTSGLLETYQTLSQWRQLGRTGRRVGG